MYMMLGVLLVWGGCGMVGLRACAALSQRVQFLEQIGLALEIMERELILNKTPLPNLLEQLSEERMGRSGSLFFRCKTELEQGKSFTRAWAVALDKSELEEREKQLLSTLNVWLGRYDARGQAEAMTHLRANWDEHIGFVRRQARGLGRVYGVLGMTVGGFLSLLLL